MFSIRDGVLYFAITQFVWVIWNAIGPVAGGVFTTRIGWRWCFWINCGLGALRIFSICFPMSPF